jgi:hypothetical protein
VDAVFLVASPQSAVVRQLLGSSAIELMSFDRAGAYTRIHQHLSMVTVPEGAIDLAANIPAKDKTLLAPTANLVVHEDFHPALIDLLLRAATEVHAGGSLFAEPGTFPSSKYTGFPLSPEAERRYELGPPFLRRYLPFWAATLVDRLKVMLLPLFALLVPCVRIMPPVYRWRIRSKVYRWYRELEVVDSASRVAESTDRLADLAAELDRIEDELEDVSVPLSYRDELYDLRLHINLVRQQLRARTTQLQQGAS